MKKKLLFPDVDCENLSKENYITISKNKLVDYYGIYPISLFLELSPGGRSEGKVYFNDLYTLTKIDKHDRDSYGVKGTHIIASDLLEEYVHAPCFVKLNFFERIYTKWYLQKYFIQDIDFKKDFWKIIIGAIIGSLITIISNVLIK